MLHGMEDEVSNVRADAEVRIRVARDAESQLSRAITTAVQRANAAAAAEARSHAEIQVLHSEIPQLDDLVTTLSEGLDAAKAAEAEVREALAIARLEHVQAKTAATKEERARAERDAREIAALGSKLAATLLAFTPPKSAEAAGPVGLLKRALSSKCISTQLVSLSAAALMT